MKIYIVAMLWSLAAYAALLVASNLIYDRWFEGEKGIITILLALLPMVPTLFTIRAIVVFLQSVDELERLIQLKSLAIAFASTAFITFTYGFLEGIGLPKLSMFCVWPLMGAIWLLARLLVGLRYT